MSKSVEKEQVLQLFQHVKNGIISPEEALIQMQKKPFEDIGYAKIDYHRPIRQGTNEVIYGQNKTTDQIIGILQNMLENNLSNILITRISSVTAQQITEAGIPIQYHASPQLGIINRQNIKLEGSIVVASGGTSDISVCEEAAITAEVFGSLVTRLYDVGVAGLHRLLAHQSTLAKARVIIAVAGMEGALPSVIGGLVSCPVIAVPTSVGYGANLGGVSALLSMLNSCANGVSVVNIDNGFGAGYIANSINKMKGLSA